MQGVVFKDRGRWINFVVKNVRHESGRWLTRDEADVLLARLEREGAVQRVPCEGGFRVRVPGGRRR